jgi:predicted metalloprotease with PDZ domain
MKSLRTVAVFLSLFASFSSSEAADAPVMVVEVDARDLPRRLVRTTHEIRCKPGTVRLWYPKWIPGTHGPKGRVQDMAGLRVETADGKPLPWRRDELDMFRFEVTVPEGVSTIRVTLDTISETTPVESAGVYTYGHPTLGAINWNTCVMYPEGVAADDQPVKLRLRLPEGWKYATALKGQKPEAGVVGFEQVSLTDLFDNPLIAGVNVRTIKLETGDDRPVYLQLASESPEALKLSQKTIDAYSKLVREALALFGVAHYQEYHFLVLCSDSISRFGVEHLSCSFNGVGERSLVDDKQRKGSFASLLPHEFAHSWCGKYRRPAEMITPDFHSPMKTKLLWVYEGLDTWLGEVLAVRCGLVTPEEYRVTFNGHLRNLSRTAGRQWRPLEDTAVASAISRQPGLLWNQLRRRQDYYQEGMMIWYEADAIIREKTEGAKSLDDFCKRFFAAVPGKKTVAGHDFEDVVRDLNAVVPYDWAAFLKRRVEEPQESYPLEVVSSLGYRLKYSDTPPPADLKAPTAPDDTATDSLGVVFAAAGQVSSVDPGLPGDKAGLTQGMKVIGVNGKKFSVNRLRDAIADSVTRKKIEFLVEEGEDFRTIVVPYAEGLRYLELERAPGKPDILADILKPRTK